MSNLRETFANPPSLYRGKPFWAWNGKLEEAELRRQIRVFHEMGLGGGFMHSRVGLATPYLSDEWFELVRACADECRKLDMEAWLYDEDRWPSGAAGGLVTKDERYRLRHLRVECVDPAAYEPTGEELGLFAATVEGTKARDVEAVAPAALANLKGRHLLVCTCVLADCSPWYNGYTYLDTLNPEAVAAFIKVTHDAYAEKLLKDFPTSIVPGIFTDEPNYGHHGRDERGANLPWTGALPAVFRERYGYDLLPHLPELAYEVDGEAWSPVRRDYYDCLCHLFVESFARQCGEWCERHGLKFTGHVLAEQTLQSQAGVVGQAMRFYEHMQAPGIDILRGQILQRDGGTAPELTTAKQCDSMRHQFGREWMLSELYGCTGWHFTFAEHKAVGDWQAALGVNLRCQHLSWYTMLGQAKRDYPASIFFQSAWWRDYRVVEDYFARIGALLTPGEPVRDVALLHPIESGWGYCTSAGSDARELHELHQKHERVLSGLLEQHLDFDYVDEAVLAEHGAVEKGRLRVAKASYRVLVVPPVVTLRGSTVAMLDRFREAGGTVVCVRPVANRLDGQPANDVLSATATVELDAEAIADAVLGAGNVRRVSVTTPDGKEFPACLYMLRQDEAGRHVLFLCHTRQKRGSGPLTVTVPAAGQVQEWDAATGAIHAQPAERRGDSVSFATELPPYGSRLFVIDPKEDASLKPRASAERVRRVELPSEPVSIDLSEPNAIPLDYASYRIGGGDWQAADEILRIDMAVRDTAGMPRRGGQMVQPWARTEAMKGTPTPVELRYNFTVETLPASACTLVMEQPELFAITLNGRTLTPDLAAGWWLDNSFFRVPVPADALREGANELVLKTTYGPNHGLECMYLTGTFGARVRGREIAITEPVQRLEPGDWGPQGLPFYTGAVTYRYRFDAGLGKSEQAVLELPEWKGVVVKVRVNGQPIGALAWPPFELPLGVLRDGSNDLEIEVMASRRNLLGPLHNPTVYPPWTGPAEFVTGGENWTDDYVLHPTGLLQAPVISVRR